MQFQKRHIGPNSGEEELMLSTLGKNSIDELINEIIPSSIRLKNSLKLPDGMSEIQYLTHIKGLSQENVPARNYIGMGYYNTIVPSVILRNVFENPGWYTSYTPYQAEISQGRMEGLLNFQTLVCDLTGMELANSSLLDEATAAAEAMIMFFNTRSKEDENAGTLGFFVDENVFPQTLSVLQTRAEPLNIKLIVGDYQKFSDWEKCFGAQVQYPAGDGVVRDYKAFVEECHINNVKICFAADLMSLLLLIPPGEIGADVVVGNSQRFGVPMGYGGPHAAFFACKEPYKRNLPGRIIGRSKDRLGKEALRMALQTREQHIKRDRATSNICTAQALLAIMAGMYSVYHGPNGLKKIANDIHNKTSLLKNKLKELGFECEHKYYFDTLRITTDKKQQSQIRKVAEDNNINFRFFKDGNIGISLDESTDVSDLNSIVSCFNMDIESKLTPFIMNGIKNENVLGEFTRESSYLKHDVFNKYHSETEMMRYLKKLENRDISLTNSMIPLGSCTMKLNAASQLIPLSWPEFANVHPFAPEYQVKGYRKIIQELEDQIAEITQLPGVSLQPNSGAQGEYSGLMVINAYHESRGDHHRNVVLIPSSAHGTNPASAVMAGMKVVVVKCDESGNIDIKDLAEKADLHSNNLSAIMITYPSTHGVFEEDVLQVTKIIHDNGGQVYMDGANMNAQVGLTAPGVINADVCHLNLHKTFAIPHGGGGPGMGPIAVAEHLKPFLPGHPVVETNRKNAVTAVSAAPWGSALILLISYGYIKMLGADGLTKSTQFAMLNANYLKKRLEEHFDILYTGKRGHVAHEMIIDCRAFKAEAHITVEDIAKRLIDYGFHAPTVSFPVAGTLMVEPTESESVIELDRFVLAMSKIRDEIQEIKTGVSDPKDNVLKNAPHTAFESANDDWNHSYSRNKACYPTGSVEVKYWSPVSRVDNAYGDRHLICTCPAIEDYVEAEV